MIIIANAGLSFYVVPFWTACTRHCANQTGTLSGLMNFFGILGATLSPYLTGVIAQATGGSSLRSCSLSASCWWRRRP